jgi:carnitine-CoA ligase
MLGGTARDGAAGSGPYAHWTSRCVGADAVSRVARFSAATIPVQHDARALVSKSVGGIADLNADDLLTEVIRRAASRAPDRIAIQEAGGQAITNSALHTAALRWARALREAGAGRHDRVAVMLPNSIQAFAVQLAVGWLGGTVVAVDTVLQGQTLSRALAVTEPVVVVVDCAGYQQLAAVLNCGLRTLRAIVVTDSLTPPAGAAGQHNDHPAVVLDAANLLGGSEPEPRRCPDPADIQTIIFTSGTSGATKPVAISHCFAARNARRLVPGGADAVGGAYYSPWSHGHSLGSVALGAAARLGVRLVLRERFAPETFWADVREFDCRTVVLVAGAGALWDSPRRSDDADNPLRYVTMVPLIPDYRGFAERFAVEVSAMYGSTETGAVLRSRRPVHHRVSGRPSPEYECRLVDQHGDAVPDGTPGELLVRSSYPQGLMSGYVGVPEGAQHPLRDGWFHTGDLFIREPGGDYCYLDRLKDSIRRRGRNISSLEVEAEALAHPAVAQCAAVGVVVGADPDAPRVDEEVKLFVVARPGNDLNPADLIEFLSTRLPRYMVPRYVELLSSLPTTGATLRPVKKVLRELPNTEATYDRYAQPAAAGNRTAARRPRAANLP